MVENLLIANSQKIQIQLCLIKTLVQHPTAPTNELRSGVMR